MSAVRPGLEILVTEQVRLLAGRRIGLLANQASVDRQFRHAADLLAAAPGVELKALFGPEHGLRGAAQDMEAVTSSRDPATGLPVHSLYGATAATLAPTPSMLDGLDLMVCDLQDVGARYYTFSATILATLAAADRAQIPVIVTDRPNPLGGEVIEGPVLAPGFESFVGRLPVPVRHGMTLGELCLMGKDHLGYDVDLQVVPMAGWTRDQGWPATGLPWVLPSPNMPSVDTAVVYPGACLVEGTTMSEGRGTTRPFEFIGAPWLDPIRFAGELNDLGHAGVRFRPHWFRPVTQKWAGVTCGGVEVHVDDPASFRSFATFVAMLAIARRQSGGQFAWRTAPYEFEARHPAIDLLAGSDRLRRDLEANRPLAEMEGEWTAMADQFRRRRLPSLLYR
ncbi:MAG: exo-beta-N-acetylmuramidase NamZ domain-containing protein [Acidobacteriota bacterium]